MGKGGGSETVTTRLDPQTERYVNEFLRPHAKKAGQGILRGDPTRFFEGVTPGQKRSLNALAGLQPGAGFEQFMQQSGGLAGSFGQAFDPSSIQSFMDPFRADVVEGTKGLFDYQRGQAQTAAKQQATKAGAFGGARSALLEGSAIADVNRQESQVIPQILSSGYSQALGAALGQHQFGQQQAGQAMQNLLAGTKFGTGLDMARFGQQFQGEELFRQIAERRRQAPIFQAGQGMNILGAGIGPYGQTQSATGGGGNPFAGAFGGAMAGAGIGGPVGGVIGGGLGLLGGLFG
jgi:hypothetical protein